MRTSKNGREFIKGFEELRLVAYPDPGTGGKPWTIGWGHTKGVKSGDKITVEQAEAFFDEDLAVFELTVNSAIRREMTQNQFDSMVSLAFNIGGAAFAGSTLVKKFNAGDASGAAEEFPRWCRSGLNVLPGLVKRRAAERKEFME